MHYAFSKELADSRRADLLREAEQRRLADAARCGHARRSAWLAHLLLWLGIGR